MTIVYCTVLLLQIIVMAQKNLQSFLVEKVLANRPISIKPIKPKETINANHTHYVSGRSMRCENDRLLRKWGLGNPRSCSN